MVSEVICYRLYPLVCMTLCLYDPLVEKVSIPSLSLSSLCPSLYFGLLLPRLLSSSKMFANIFPYETRQNNYLLYWKKILHVDSYEVSLILLHDLLVDPTTLKIPVSAPFYRKPGKSIHLGLGILRVLVIISSTSFLPTHFFFKLRS